MAIVLKGIKGLFGAKPPVNTETRPEDVLRSQITGYSSQFVGSRINADAQMNKLTTLAEEWSSAAPNKKLNANCDPDAWAKDAAIRAFDHIANMKSAVRKMNESLNILNDIAPDMATKVAETYNVDEMGEKVRSAVTNFNDVLRSMAGVFPATISVPTFSNNLA